MSEVLSSEDSNLAMNAICHAAAMTQETLRCAIGEYERPSVLFRPKIYFTVTGAPVYLAAGAAPAKMPECQWLLEDDESGTWRSSCGELWSFIDGGPRENRVTYCHHCGGGVTLASDKGRHDRV